MEWVVKIILKDMKMGLNHGPLLKHFHRDALKHFDGCQNLKNVCTDLANPDWTFCNEIKLMDIISPMLSQRCTWTGQMVQIAKDLGNRFAIETKYDGDRIVCHKEGDLIRFFTRNGKEDLSHYSSWNRKAGYGFNFFKLSEQLRSCKCSSAHAT